MFSLHERCEIRYKWMENVQEMDDNRISKAAMIYKTENDGMWDSRKKVN
jgi:hypothetical protein